MANGGGGVVVTGLILGVALWVPVARHGADAQYDFNAPEHHSAASQQGSGQAHHPRPPTVTSQTGEVARLIQNADAVFKAKITGAHARMYRGSPQPYRLFSFKPL